VVSVNNITADRNDDATITVRFGGGDQSHTLPIMDGLELRSTPLPAPPGNTRPDLDLSHRHAECERRSGRTWNVTNLRGGS